jgi:hypothetical protein
MGMRASAVLAYGVIIDEDKHWEIMQDREDHFYEYMEDNYPGLDITSSGADGYDVYIVGPSKKHKYVEWGEWFKISQIDLKDPTNTIELAKFCEDHKIDVDYDWYLGAYFG